MTTMLADARKNVHIFRRAGVIFLAVWYALLSTHLIAFLVSVDGQPSLMPVSSSGQAVSNTGTTGVDTGESIPGHENHSTSEDFLCMFCEMDVLSFTIGPVIPSRNFISSLPEDAVQFLYRLNLDNQAPPELLIPDSLLKIPISLG